MARRSITEHIWHDPEVKNYIMLDITDVVEPPSAVIIDGIKLLPKDEYHCSLVPAGKLSDDPTVVEGIVEDVAAYLQADSGAVRFDGIGDQYYVCKKDDEMTLIVEAKIIGLDGLRQIVRRRAPDYEPAFPHVTLLKSFNSPYGIGINSFNDLQTYCRAVSID